MLLARPASTTVWDVTSVAFVRLLPNDIVGPYSTRELLNLSVVQWMLAAEAVRPETLTAEMTGPGPTILRRVGAAGVWPAVSRALPTPATKQRMANDTARRTHEHAASEVFKNIIGVR